LKWDVVQHLNSINPQLKILMNAGINELICDISAHVVEHLNVKFAALCLILGSKLAD